MIQYAEALSILRDAAGKRNLSTETVPLTQAVGRIVHEAVQSPEEVPSFDNSAMDGFAVASRHVAHASPSSPVRIRVAGTIMAGDPPPTENDPQVAWEIMTGAPMPQGPQDSVIKIEDVEVVRDAQDRAKEIILRRAVEFEENVRARGEDFQVGQTVLPALTRILPEHVMALASLGIPSIRALAQPKVAIISTGDELVPHDVRTLQPGMIRNSTGPYLTTAVPFYGAQARFYGTVNDSIEKFLSLLEKVRSERPDIIVTTGAVSMGKHDFIPEALRKIGAEVRYHKVAIRPGKPGIFAELPSQDQVPGPVFFGSPGNPISTAVALRFFIWPYLRALQGLPPEIPTRAVLMQSSSKPEGLRCFFKARVEVNELGQKVLALKGQPSFMVSPLLQANAWVVFPESGASAPENSLVQVYPLFPHFDQKEGLCPP